MSRPKNPTEKTGGHRNKPSTGSKASSSPEEYDRNTSIPGRKTPEYEKQQARILNEDDQKKVVNQKEVNAQSQGEASSESDAHDRPTENQNERLEAGDDNSEVNPRPRKVT